MRIEQGHNAGAQALAAPSVAGVQDLSGSSVARVLAFLVAFTCVMPLSGCSLLRRRQTVQFPPPQVFQQDPTLPQIVDRVNRSLRITRLQSDNLTVSGPDMPTSLNGHIKWERPYNFKLEASLPFLGTALSAGSNEEMFWLQTQVPSPPSLYYARHDEFIQQQGPRTILPVSPLWLREAMGVIELDPTLPHEGPFLLPNDQLEVRTVIALDNNNPQNVYRRYIRINRRTGVIEETLLYDHTKRLIAQSKMSGHEYHSSVDYSLPRKAIIQLLPAGNPPISFTVEVGFYLINQDTGAVDSFVMPDSRGLVTVNIAAATLPTGGSPASHPALNGASSGTLAPGVSGGYGPAQPGLDYRRQQAVPMGRSASFSSPAATPAYSQPPAYTASGKPANQRFDFNRYRR